MRQAKIARPFHAVKCAGSNDPAALLQLVLTTATGVLCRSTVAHLRDALAEDGGSITLVQDVQEIMRRHNRGTAKVQNAVLTLSRALEVEAD